MIQIQDFAVRYWVQKGAPKAKMNVAMALYGRTFTLADSSNYYPGDPTIGEGQALKFTRTRGMISYFEVIFLSVIFTPSLYFSRRK